VIRLRRSERAVPANNKRMISNAVRSAADLVLFDFEETVPAAEGPKLGSESFQQARGIPERLRADSSP
jgi:citrate lyase beta subunit